MPPRKTQTRVKAYQVHCERGCGRFVICVESIHSNTEDKSSTLDHVCDYCKTDDEKTDFTNIMFNPFRQTKNNP